VDNFPSCALFCVPTVVRSSLPSPLFRNCTQELKTCFPIIRVLINAALVLCVPRNKLLAFSPITRDRPQSFFSSFSCLGKFSKIAGLLLVAYPVPRLKFPFRISFLVLRTTLTHWLQNCRPTLDPRHCYFLDPSRRSATPVRTAPFFCCLLD